MADFSPRPSSTGLLLLALALAMIGGAALACGWHWQSRLDVASTEARLAALFRPLLRADDAPAVRQQVRDLQTDARLALSFLAVRDATGQVLASGGVFESLRLPLVPTLRRVQVRTQLYRLTGDSGLAVVEDDAARPLGQVEFTRFKQLQAEVDAAALVALRRVGLSLLLVAGGLLIWAAWRRLRPAAAPDPDLLRDRLRGRRAAPSLTAAEPSPDAELRAGLALLGALDVAVIRFDAEGRVLAMNTPAERWSGWRERDAQTRPLATVLHLRGADDQPLPVTPQALLAEPTPEVLQNPLMLLNRTGTRQQVDIKVMADPRGGRDGGAMLLSDASHRLGTLAALEAETRMMREALTQLDEAILIVNRNGAVHAAHGCASALFGYADDQWRGLTLAKLFPVPFVQMPELTLAAFEPDQADAPAVRAWRNDAHSFPVTLRAHRLHDDHRGWVVTVRDLREAGQLHVMAQRERRWFELGADQAFVLDAHTLSFIEVSAAAKAALGYPPARWSQLSLPSIAPELDRAAFQSWLRALRDGQVEVVHYSTRHRNADGEWIPVRVALQYLDDAIRPVFLATAMRLETADA